MLPDGSVATALEWPVGVPEQADPDADPYELTVAEMDVANLRRVLPRLPASHGRAVRLHFGIGVREHTVRETAEVMGMRPSTCQDLITDGLHRLAVLWDTPNVVALPQRSEPRDVKVAA